MSYSYWLGVRPDSGVNLSGPLPHFRFGTLFLNRLNGPLSVSQSLPAVALIFFFLVPASNTIKTVSVTGL
jgi:hypothetical protein